MVVKVTTLAPEWPLVRQTPNSSGIWEDFHFFVNDPTISECDFWVVIEGLPVPEHVRCSPLNTMLLTWEPPAIRTYSNDFVAQFRTVISCHQFSHPGLLATHQALQWMIGARNVGGTWTDFKDYDYLRALKPEKNRELSIIVSNKTACDGHKQRNMFVDLLRKHFGRKLDVFGTGINPIPDKMDGIYPYKYHVVLENSAVRSYWSEKLADAFIGWSYPLYYGCPDIREYFPDRSLTPIDIYHPEEAVGLIETVLKGNLFEKHFEDIVEARTRVLERHNVFPFLARQIREHRLYRSSDFGAKNVRLLPESAFTRPRLAARVRRILQRAVGTNPS